MSVAELTAHAEEMRRLRQDNAALQCTLERVTAERDNWRTRATEAAFQFQQFKLALLRMCKDAQ